MSTESMKNHRFLPLHCRLTPHLKKTLANIRINLISPETAVHERSAADNMDPSLLVFTKLFSKSTQKILGVSE